MRNRSPKTPYDMSGLEERNLSPSLRAFVQNFFENTLALSRGELDLAFLKELSPADVLQARTLVQRNLHLRYTSIIEGLGLLGDASDAQSLQDLLNTETEPSRRLTIGKALWRIRRDPQFPTLLEQMIASDDVMLKQAHIDDVLLLGDHRSIAFLTRLLDDDDPFVRHLALGTLNALEFSAHYLTPTFPHDAEYYRTRQSDAALVQRLVSNLVVDRAQWPVHT